MGKTMLNRLGLYDLVGVFIPGLVFAFVLDYWFSFFGIDWRAMGDSGFLSIGFMAIAAYVVGLFLNIAGQTVIAPLVSRLFGGAASQRWLDGAGQRGFSVLLSKLDRYAIGHGFPAVSKSVGNPAASHHDFFTYCFMKVITGEGRDKVETLQSQSTLFQTLGVTFLLLAVIALCSPLLPHTSLASPESLIFAVLFVVLAVICVYQHKRMAEYLVRAVFYQFVIMEDQHSS